jgi:hypothetical protein
MLIFESKVETCAVDTASLCVRAACLQSAGDKCRDYAGGKTATGGTEEMNMATETAAGKKCALPVHPKLLNAGSTLETKPLWDEFNELGTEMIVTKAGRCVPNIYFHTFLYLFLLSLRSSLSFFLLSYPTFYTNMRKYCVGEKYPSQDVDGFTNFQLPSFKKNVFGMPSISLCLSVCKYLWICTSLAPERLVGFYSHSAFKSLSNIGQYPVNIDNSTPKIGALHKPPKLSMTISPEMALEILINFSNLWIGGIFWKTTWGY